MAKQYAEPQTYEAKLERIMTRLGIERYDYDWNRLACWVEFTYKGQPYRFEHSIDNAQAHGVNIKYGSDVFAQVVLALEDLARMVERGIYDLSTWVAGMKYLPEKSKVPSCLEKLGFAQMPTAQELKSRWKQIAKVSHPDAGGDEVYFVSMKTAYEEAEALVKEAENHERPDDQRP